jgi:hypothetical protein
MLAFAGLDQAQGFPLAIGRPGQALANKSDYLALPIRNRGLFLFSTGARSLATSLGHRWFFRCVA